MPFRGNRKPSLTARQARLNNERLPKRDVFSYHARRSESPAVLGREEAQSVRATKPTHRFWHLLPGLLALAAVVVCAIYATVLDTSPRIKVIGADDVSSYLRPSSEYYQTAHDLLQESVLNRNKVTIDTERISRRMESEFPELSSVTTILPLISHRPIIEIKANRPVMVLAGNTGSGDFLIDNTGRALVTNNKVSGDALKGLPVVTDESNLPLGQGKNVLPKQTVEFLTTVHSQLISQGIPIENMSLPPQPNRLHVKLAGKPYYLKFNVLMDPKQASGNAVAVLRKFEAEHIVPTQYIDFRIEERFFYL